MVNLINTDLAIIMAVGIYPAVLTNVINMGIAPIARLIGM